MNNLELFRLIKENAEYFSIEDVISRSVPSEQEQQQPSNRLKDISRLLSDYNLKTFLEIKSRDCIDVVIEQVNLEILNEFTFRIDNYLNKHAPDQDELKRYIQIVATYLTFIAGKPLHPPGMTFESGDKIIGRDNKFYCPMKNKQLHGALSVCKYCVSRDISEMSDTSEKETRRPSFEDA